MNRKYSNGVFHFFLQMKMDKIILVKVKKDGKIGKTYFVES